GRVLGGLCAIAVTLNEKREVVQLQPMQSLGFGERDNTISERVRAIADAFAKGNCGTAASAHVIQDMWEKWVFLASLAASTSLMRTSVGNILAAPDGKDFLLGMLDECSAVATAEGYPPNGPFFQRTRGLLTTEGSPMTASMFRDIKAGLPVEADHVIGDMIARGDAAKVPVPRLRIAYTHLKAYEKQRGEGSSTLAPLSSLRTQGPITTDVRCCERYCHSPLKTKLRSPDGAKRNPGDSRAAARLVPDFASLHPGYATSTLAALSSLRTQGPITNGLHCCQKYCRSP